MRGLRTQGTFTLEVEKVYVGLKMRVPIAGLRVKLIPTDEEIRECEQFGLELARELMGLRETRVLNFAEL